tara:strand:+ start:361 stop:546 length:186 start_codon:yes stop_codon:yes gene_type:complete
MKAQSKYSFKVGDLIRNKNTGRFSIVIEVLSNFAGGERFIEYGTPNQLWLSLGDTWTKVTR